MGESKNNGTVIVGAGGAIFYCKLTNNGCLDVTKQSAFATQAVDFTGVALTNDASDTASCWAAVPCSTS